MAFSPAKSHHNRLHFLRFLTLLSLFFMSHARPSLDRSDSKALSTILKDLGITGQRFPATNPCSAAGVSCERRLAENNSYVLKVTRLVFKYQKLGGSLTPAIGKLSELKEVSVSHNSIADQLPPEIVHCKKLEILDLGNNMFSGEIPSNLSSLIRLRVLDLSSNKFTGDLSFLKHFPNLENLSLANNLFSGKIPSSIRSFRNLGFFDFSGNNLLQGNYGSAPSQQPKRYIFAEKKSTNNSSSAQAPSPNGSKSATAEGPRASSSPGEHHKHKSKRALEWILGFFAGAIGGGISGFVFSVTFKLVVATIRGAGKHPGPSIFSPMIKKAEDLAFLEKEDGLASLEIIGKGGCGEVYKAELPGSNGKLIAIKKVIQPPKDAAELTDEDSKLLNKKMRQIRSEITTVGQIRHRNLLPLLAHVSRPDCHYLVIADFGLAKALPDAYTHVTTSNLAGTVGYIAPEYHQTLKFTDKCDIYSFGVILCVLVMGKLPSDEFFQHTDEMSLVKWMRNIMVSDNPTQAIDPKLIGKGFEEQMTLVLKIAYFCTLDDPKERPNSKDVRCMLYQIKS
ncbi:SUPPRESSOR OF BIR1 1, EVERSHED [Hibiscus trionum]|uniref:SUPPRESSOR OF BIR1 1, EVERSHED n=1 Tax=Hibiscus trionum TaxID=183268 RepID=A0A9W7HLU0_HIBTR|nr:SUPPRESSOR OF BIR1 1, EVERSHED [Hibiscus trionum]